MLATGIPVLHIIFYLAVVFSPCGTTGFTTSYADHEITWTQQADGWQGVVDGQQAIGTWSADGLTVAVTDYAEAGKVDLSELVKVDQGDDQKKQVTVDQQPVTVSSTESTVTFSQGKDGTFATPVVITYATE